MSGRRIVFCGVGALGSHAALLCRNVDATLVFVDFDRVESKNLLSQVYVKPSIGKNKADALKLQLYNFHGIKCEALGVRVVEENVATVFAGATLVVDAFDNAASRRVLSAHARASGTPLVHAGISADGAFGMVRWDARFVPDEEDTPGQATCENGAHLPMVGQVSSALARIVQDFVTNGETRDALVTGKAVTPDFVDG